MADCLCERMKRHRLHQERMQVKVSKPAYPAARRENRLVATSLGFVTPRNYVGPMKYISQTPQSADQFMREDAALNHQHCRAGDAEERLERRVFDFWSVLPSALISTCAFYQIDLIFHHPTLHHRFMTLCAAHALS